MRLPLLRPALSAGRGSQRPPAGSLPASMTIRARDAMHLELKVILVLLLAVVSFAAAAPPLEDNNRSRIASLRTDGGPKAADIAAAAAAAGSAHGLVSRSSDGRIDSSPPGQPRPVSASTRPTLSSDLVLSNVVILTSVEGGLYALDRRSGDPLWSLPPQSSHNSDSLLRPLVTALYGKDQNSFAEIAQGMGGQSAFANLAAGSMADLQAGGIYIVEPSSAGDIYVLTSKAGADGTASRDMQGMAGQVQLDKLPLTLPQLVELSPFSFAGDDTRVFVGQKQTTLVELDVRTGKLGAVFGGREGGVWCGAQHSDQQGAAAPRAGRGTAADQSAEACIDDEPVFSSTTEANEWAYVGRTDYTLNIHSRNSPELLQTLHFSTFAPNAGDRDIQSLWYRADHPDDRAIMGMPEDGSVVCFNLSSTEAKEEEKTLWMSDLRASVAGIFDVVYPASHLQNTKSMSRPILVSHPPVSINRIFPQISSGSESDEGSQIPSLGDGSKHRTSAYLGLAGNSLFAMSGNRFPLVAFTSKAVAGLADGQTEVDRPGGSALPPSESSWAHEKKCASFGCWLGSYSLLVDASAEGAMQESLLGSDRLLEIDGERPDRPRLAIGDKPANTGQGGEQGSSETKGSTSTPGRSKSSPRKTPESSKGKGRGRGGQDDFETPSVPPPPISADEAGVYARPWKSRLSRMLLQLIGILIIGILTGTTYIGFQQQAAKNEWEAANIAKGVVWVPALKEQEAGFALGGADAEKVAAAEAKQLEEAIRRSKQDDVGATRAKAGAEAGPSEQTDGAAQDIDGLGLDIAEDGLPGGAAAAKKRASKRRRRGKRAGAAAAARAAKAAKNGDGVDESGDEDGDERADDMQSSPKDGEEGTGESGPIDASASANRSRARSDSTATTQGSTSTSDGNSADRPKQGKKGASTANGAGKGNAKQKSTPAVSIVTHGTPQITQALMSPKLNTSSLMESGWPVAGDRDDSMPTTLGEQAAKIAAAGAASSFSSTNGMKSSSLIISDEVLGYGSSGTVVFKGTFQGRAVAVKRLLRDFVNVASKEVSLLESADNHPNVIRYFYKELTPSFLFIALELCPASLADVVERPNDYRELSVLLEPKRTLSQITSGLRHLHSLSIVHRDIKPQNILVSTSSSGRSLKMLLSDFGLSKRLDGMAQTSFSQTMNNPGGTVGWRAPEILRGDVNLDAGSESESSLGNSSGARNGSGATEEKLRLTRAVDIFALGCLAYYVLSNGDHPFGSRFEREMNIIRRHVDTSRLDGLGEEGHEAQDLVLKMVDNDPRQRPSANDVLTHPYFWDANKRLNFLQDASDRFEIMEKEPPTAALVMLEAKAQKVLGHDWHRRCDKAFLENLGKFRKYDPTSVQDLLRAMRNKKHHYQDMPPHLKRMLGALPDGFLGYFTRRFPELFLHVHGVITAFPLIRTEAMFREYFVCPEQDH